jgi:predicted branched-subunit amino acid permease
MFAAWLLGTMCAGVFSQAIARPELLALDFLLVAFCAAAAVEAVRARPDRASLRCGLAAVASAWIVDRLNGSAWTTVAAGLAAIGVAWWTHENSSVPA